MWFSLYWVLSWRIFIYISFFLIIAFISTYFISIKIQRETDSILYFLKEITNKKKPIFLQSNYTFEFYKIAKLLNKVAKKLSKKDEIKAKHTAKLTLANRQKDDIISAISHEFKNPIAIISGYSQTLIEDENLSLTLKIKFLNTEGNKRFTCCNICKPIPTCLLTNKTAVLSVKLFGDNKLLLVSAGCLANDGFAPNCISIWLSFLATFR